MAQSPSSKHNPNQPWALTDALLEILTKNLIKTHRQYLEITGTYSAALAQPNQHLEFPSAPGEASTLHNGLRAIAPRPSPGPFEQTSGDIFQASLKAENEARGHKALVPSPFFEDHGSTISYPNKNSGVSMTSAPQGSPPLTDHIPSMDHLEDLGFSDADYADEHVHESEFEAAVPIDPNLAYRGFEQVSQTYQSDGHASASGPSEAIDPALMMLNRHAQVGHSYYGHASDERVFYANPNSDPSPAMRLAVTPGMRKRLTASPFFARSGNTKSSQLQPIRPLPGTVSCIEFPTLEANRFGIIQEELADDPFRLLIAVTFLIKTKGTAAIPTFRQVIQRFPTQQDLADPTSTPLLIYMIRHLGLSERRAKSIQRIARGWLDRPPSQFARYPVRNYVQRELDMNDTEFLQHNYTTLSRTDTMTPDTPHDVDSWEIGHLTQGRYALDSWRIFCRDVLLGKALDWKGTGAQDSFQPEWMRVLPQDKELRAFLRWMWMKEGWEWDPKTGEKFPLRPEMWKAVNEKGVSWDHEGNLVICDEL
jgi:hypothetical protein